MKLNRTQLVGLLLLAIATYPQWSPLVRPIPPTPPAPVVPAPSVDLQAAVAPVAALLRNSPDASGLAKLWADMAAVIPTSKIETLEQLYAFHRRAVEMAYPNRVGPTGLGVEIDKILRAQVGGDAAPLDAEKRGKAVAVFQALAWAAGGGNG